MSSLWSKNDSYKHKYVYIGEYIFRHCLEKLLFWNSKTIIKYLIDKYTWKMLVLVKLSSRKADSTQLFMSKLLL